MQVSDKAYSLIRLAAHTAVRHINSMCMLLRICLHYTIESVWTDKDLTYIMQAWDKSYEYIQIVVYTEGT